MRSLFLIAMLVTGGITLTSTNSAAQTDHHMKDSSGVEVWCGNTESAWGGTTFLKNGESKIVSCVSQHDYPNNCSPLADVCLKENDSIHGNELYACNDPTVWWQNYPKADMKVNDDWQMNCAAKQ